MPNPEAILFDAGHTLVFIDPDRTRAIFREVGVDVSQESFSHAELTARKELTLSVRDGHMGTEPELWHQYFIRLFRESGVPEESLDRVGSRVREVHRDEHLWTGVAPGTAEILDSLLYAGYRLGVISNADGRMESVLEAAGLRDRLEFVVDSDRVGLAKPDPGIFLDATRRLGLPPEACLYVGDLYPVDVVGARSAGMDALLLDPTGMLDLPVDRIPNVSALPDYLEDRGR